VTPSRFANGSASTSSNSTVPFNTRAPDHSSGPSHLDSPHCNAFGGDFGFEDHDGSVGATVTSPRTPCQKKRLEPHLIPFSPTPSKLAAIEAFDKENPEGLGLSEVEIDNLLDTYNLALAV
jgi:hypothetical protein